MKNLFPYIFLGLLILFEIYLFTAFRTAARDSSTVWKRFALLSYILITAIFYGTIIIGITAGRDFGLGKFLQGYSITLFLGFFLMKAIVGSFLFIEDIYRIGHWAIYSFSPKEAGEVFSNSRKQFLSRVALVVGTIPVLTLLNGAIRSAYNFKVYTQNVKIKNLPAALKDFHIVQISDLHAGSMIFEKRLVEAVEMINELKPDLVFFTGDMVNTIADEALPFIDILKEIKAKYGVFSVLGNHDYGDYHDWKNKEDKNANLALLSDIQSKMGFDLLRNENRIINVEGTKLAVIGVENWSNRRYFPAYGKLDEAYKGCSNCAVKLLLSHDPTHWREQVITHYTDIDITFSGHTHGFQFGIEIPWLKWSPAKYAYPEWAGIYKKAKQYLYVNRGIGHLGYPGRVGILPEISSIKLS